MQNFRGGANWFTHNTHEHVKWFIFSPLLFTSSFHLAWKNIVKNYVKNQEWTLGSPTWMKTSRSARWGREDWNNVLELWTQKRQVKNKLCDLLDWECERPYRSPGTFNDRRTGKICYERKEWMLILFYLYIITSRAVTFGCDVVVISKPQEASSQVIIHSRGK